jgi:hypothetical protein
MNPIRWFCQVCSAIFFSLGLVVAGALTNPANTPPKQLASAVKFVDNQGAASVLVASSPNGIDPTGCCPKEGSVVIHPVGQDRFDDVAPVTPGLWPQLLPPEAFL